jgi:hypothetical protein
VVTNTGVEGTDEPVCDILPGEDSTVTLSEIHDLKCEFDNVCVCVCVCNKKVHTIITDLDDG